MSDGIRIQKTTLLLMFGLLAAVVTGVYVINAQPQAVQNTCAGQEGACLATEAPKPPEPAPQATTPRVGCGCGGGGFGCGLDVEAEGQGAQNALLFDDGAAEAGNLQEIYIRAKNDGTYDVEQLSVTSKEPVRLHFRADSNAGCGRQIVIYGLGIKAVSVNGEESIVDFVPQEPGTYEYNCGMRMWKGGKLVVT